MIKQSEAGTDFGKKHRGGYEWPHGYGDLGQIQRKIPHVTRAGYEQVLKICEEEHETYSHPLMDGTIKPILSVLPSVEHLIFGVEEAMDAPVTIRSYGPRAEDKSCP